MRVYATGTYPIKTDSPRLALRHGRLNPHPGGQCAGYRPKTDVTSPEAGGGWASVLLGDLHQIGQPGGFRRET